MKYYGITITEVSEEERYPFWKSHKERTILQQVIDPEDFELRLILQAILDGLNQGKKRKVV